MSQMPYSIIASKQPRNKSSDKVSHDPLNPSSINKQNQNLLIKSSNIQPSQKKNITSNIGNGNMPIQMVIQSQMQSQQMKKMQPRQMNNNNIIKSNVVQIEGDLNFKQRGINNTGNIQKSINNYGLFDLIKQTAYNNAHAKNTMNTNNSSSLVNNNTSSNGKGGSRKGSKHIPRKSPIPPPRGYMQNNYLVNNINNNNGIGNNNIQGIPMHYANINFMNNMQHNNGPINNNINNNNAINIHNSQAKLYHGMDNPSLINPSQNNRGHSPMTKSKTDNAIKLSPNTMKKRFVSKSPILGKSTLLNKFKKYHIINQMTNKKPTPTNQGKGIILIKNMHSSHSHNNMLAKNQNIILDEHQEQENNRQNYHSNNKGKIDNMNQQFNNKNYNNGNGDADYNMSNTMKKSSSNNNMIMSPIINNNNNISSSINNIGPDNNRLNHFIGQGNINSGMMKNNYVNMNNANINNNNVNNQNFLKNNYVNSQNMEKNNLNNQNNMNNLNNINMNMNNNVNPYTNNANERLKRSMNSNNNSNNINQISNLNNIPNYNNPQTDHKQLQPSNINPNMNILNQNNQNRPPSNTTSKPRSHSSSGPKDVSELMSNSNDKTSISNTNIDRHIVPYKIQKKIKNYYTFTHVGFDGEQDKANNQDNYFIEKKFANNPSYYYMSVCDGHGVEGHEVSGFIKRILPIDMSRNLSKFNIITTDLNQKRKMFETISRTFIQANEKLVYNENINSLFSGSTCVSLIYTPCKLIIPNIGDSRAIIGRYNKLNNTWSSHDLSRDHKPTEKDECQRIIQCNGRIQPFIDEENGQFVGPQRIWLKEDDVPGLAMTRSFGDRVAATVGVISEPEIFEYEFREDDKFFIIASDGVWEFISSEECARFIGDYYFKGDLEGCCNNLYLESKKRWLKEEEVVDDITMILVFLE